MLLQAKYQCKSENNCLLTLYDINIYIKKSDCGWESSRMSKIAASAHCRMPVAQ